MSCCSYEFVDCRRKVKMGATQIFQYFVAFPFLDALSVNAISSEPGKHCALKSLFMLLLSPITRPYLVIIPSQTSSSDGSALHLA